MGVTASIQQEKLRGIPGFKMALVVLLLGVFVGGTFPIGPVIPAVTAICALVAGIKIFRALRRRNADYAQNPSFRRAYYTISAIAVVCLVLSGIYSTARAASMDPADKIMMWSGTVTSRRWERLLHGADPNVLEQNRELVRITDDEEGANAAKRLAKSSQSRQDMLLIVDALARHERSQYSYLAGSYRTALKTITALDLPDTATAVMWRAEIEKL